jgi:hypothetical protein
MKKKLASFVILVGLSVYACEHKPDVIPCVAGSGGSVSIVVYAKHGNSTIPNYFTHPDTAFIKFGTKIFPGSKPSNYDIFFVGESAEDHIHCMGLKCGDYFIYRTAWDSVHHVTLYGGSPISFLETDQSKEIIIEVN